MPPPIDIATYAELSKGFIALMATAIGGLSAALVWVVKFFTGRENTTIKTNTDAVESVVDVVEANTKATNFMGEQMQVANQLKHDEQLIANDRRNRGDQG